MAGIIPHDLRARRDPDSTRRQGGCNETESLFTGAAAVALAVHGHVGRWPPRPNPAKMAKLRNPAALAEQAPATYKANIDTSKGTFVITVHRDWAPIGADRFYNLVKNGFYDDVRFFRVIPGFMAQFGIHGDPAVASAWRARADQG